MSLTDALATPAGELPDAAQIAALVDQFYDRIQVHPQLGPIFNAFVHDWPAHKQLLTSFWCSVILREGSYRGNPMAAHFNRGIHTEHFVQWLALWRETADALLSPAQAVVVHEYANRIGRSLRYGLGLPEPRADVVHLEVLGDAGPRGPRPRLPRGGQA